MSAAWLTHPLQLDGSRTFQCDPLTTEECDYYMQRWHFWYIADHVFALPTVAFFMCTIGVFIIGHAVSSLWLGNRSVRGPRSLGKLIVAIRYLSYRGIHVKPLRWNSAPIGLLLLAFVGAVFFSCMGLIPQPYYWSDEMYGGSPPLATRSGWMSLACMPFVFATASKTNWITLLTGVPHEKLQVFHRWIAYAFFILALMHTFPFIVYHIRWHDMEEHFSSSLLFYWTGIVALVFQAWLTFASHSTIRNLGYEFFKVTHFFGVAVFVVTFFWHCDYTLTSWDYFVASAAVYVPCYIYPWLCTIFEYGLRQNAQIVVEDNGFICIRIPFKSNWKPGQHCFLRFTSFGVTQAISAHPFTICSLSSNDPHEHKELVFYIRHKRGLTAKLYKHALEQPGSSMPILVDGPYGGINLQKYNGADRLIVIAGGSGAGWCLPLIELFCRHQSTAPDKEHSQQITTDGEQGVHTCTNSGPLSLQVVLATRDNSNRIWFLRAVSELLAKYPAIESASKVRVKVFLTGEAAEHVDLPYNDSANPAYSKISGSSADKVSVQGGTQKATIEDKTFEGRPRLPLIVHEEADKSAAASQSLGVFVCGPDTMQDDVRNAVAGENLNILKGSKAKGVYLHLEHFSWA